MANPTEPATSPIFRALRSVDVDPDLAYEAAEASRLQAGENVIAAIGAQITELKAELKAQGARIDGRFSQIEAQIIEVKSELKAQGARIDDLQKVVWRVIWPLIVLLAVPVFGCSTGFLLTPLVNLSEAGVLQNRSFVQPESPGVPFCVPWF